MRKLFYVLIISIVMIFGLTFVYKNQQIVTVDYYGSQPWGFSWEGELSLLVIATFVIGMVTGFLLLSLSLSLIHISEPTRPTRASRMPSSA